MSNQEESYEEVQRIKYDLWAETPEIELEAASVQKKLVAEGDSWFDYPPGLDILDNLKRDFDYKIFKISRAGDTLENMVYGTEITGNFSRRTPQILLTLDAIKKHRPKVFLFSGGGNDIAGAEFESFLNHRDSGLAPLLRQEYVKTVFEGAVKSAYSYLFKRIWAEDPEIHIISHGYGYPIPDGRAVLQFPFGLQFIGPWLRPALTRKNILDRHEGEDILKKLIDRFNETLEDLAATNDHFHYLDLRPHIYRSDWVNELHLYNQGYRRVAGLFDQEIRKYV